MSGPVVLLICLVEAAVLFLGFLWVDTLLTRHEYQRRIRGDEVQRYADARAAIARAQTTHPAYKHQQRRHRKGDTDD